MILLSILAALSVLTLLAALWSALSHDPPREIPRSHPQDRRFQPPYFDAA